MFLWPKTAKFTNRETTVQERDRSPEQVNRAATIIAPITDSPIGLQTGQHISCGSTPPLLMARAYHGAITAILPRL